MSLELNKPFVLEVINEPELKSRLMMSGKSAEEVKQTFETCLQRKVDVYDYQTGVLLTKKEQP